MDVRVHRTRMTRIERIDADLIGFYPLAGAELLEKSRDSDMWFSWNCGAETRHSRPPVWSLGRSSGDIPFTHRVGDKSVEGRPGLSDVRREAWTKPLFECPNERFTDGFVIAFTDPIAGMAAAQRGEGGQEGVRAVKPFNRQPDHLHQLAPLLLHVAIKKRPERGIEFEQTAIEQGGGRIRDGPDLRKASLHQCLLNQIHNHSPYL